MADRCVSAGVIAVLVLAGCSAETTAGPEVSPSATSEGPLPRIVQAGDCADLATRTVDHLQQYVDGFAGVAANSMESVALGIGVELEESATAASRRAAELGCGQQELFDLLRGEVDRLEGDGPVADAVVATLRADLLGTVDPADRGPQELRVSTGRELVDAVRTAGSGSTITVTAPEVAVDETLVLLRPVTIAGSGPADTVIRSTAAGAALLAVTDGTARIEGLTLEHTGEAPASVVVVRRGGYDLDDVLVRGARPDDAGAGGFAIVLRPDDRAPHVPVERRLVDVTLDDNRGGGLVVALTEAPTIDGIAVTGAGACGLCYLDGSAGRVRDARIDGATVGVLITDSAEPEVRAAHLRASDVGIAVVSDGHPRIVATSTSGGRAGMEITDSDPTVSDLTVDGADEVGVRITGGDAAVAGVTVTGQSRVGVSVTAGAPSLTDVAVHVDGEVGVAYDRTASGTATGLSVSGARLGLQISGSSDVTVTDAELTGLGEAAILVADSATPTLSAISCDGTDTAVIGIGVDATPTIGEDVTCDVVEQGQA